MQSREEGRQSRLELSTDVLDLFSVCQDRLLKETAIVECREHGLLKVAAIRQRQDEPRITVRTVNGSPKSREVPRDRPQTFSQRDRRCEEGWISADRLCEGCLEVDPILLASAHLELAGPHSAGYRSDRRSKRHELRTARRHDLRSAHAAHWH